MSPMLTPYYDRREAGKLLATYLQTYAQRPDVLVLGLARGGVAVAAEIAEALHAPLDVFVVRKLGVPGHEELAMGAIASGGVRVVNENVLRSMSLSSEVLEEVAAVEEPELERREKLYRGNRPPLEVEGRIVIVVDDGLATGATMRAAVAALREHNPAWIVVAVPVAARDTASEFQMTVDEVICARTPEPFLAVGLSYDHFPQLTDAEVRDLLQQNAEQRVEES